MAVRKILHFAFLQFLNVLTFISLRFTQKYFFHIFYVFYIFFTIAGFALFYNFFLQFFTFVKKRPACLELAEVGSANPVFFSLFWKWLKSFWKERLFIRARWPTRVFEKIKCTFLFKTWTSYYESYVARLCRKSKTCCACGVSEGCRIVWGWLSRSGPFFLVFEKVGY